MRTLLRHRWWTALGVVIVVAGGFCAYWFTRGGSSASADATTYRLVAASTGTIRQSVSATGTIEPAVQDSLNFQVSGQVTSVRASQGQKVKKGAVLATVDSAALRVTLTQARASLASSQARLASDTDASASATQLAADRAAVTAARDQVTSAKASLAQAKLTSPISGVVASVSLSVGQQVAGSSGGGGNNGTGSSSVNGNSSSGSSAQVLVISTDSWIVNATVDSSGVGLLATGDQAQIVPGSGAGTVYGTIDSIGLIASSSSNVASYPVVIAVTGSPKGMHAGDSATVTLIYKQLTNVLTVPTAAVHTVNGASVVYQMVDNKRTAKTVTVGLASGGTTQIKSGLAEGDQVVLDVATGTGNRGTTGNNNRNNQQQFPGGGQFQFPGGGVQVYNGGGNGPVMVGPGGN
ncbi:MAG: biotin/lipoyl-binding protein [Actinomycetia bacterium]|nr:biotin/lipoyl-binding protein [Actinomycetes bacterium]